MKKTGASLFERLVEIAVRGFFGALLGLLVGFSGYWWFWIDNAVVGWWFVGTATLICTLLAVKYGDAFWENLREWCDTASDGDGRGGRAVPLTRLL